MIIKHAAKKGFLSKEVDYNKHKFTLTNKKNAFYTSNLDGKQDSRYNGLYTRINDEYFKTLESIRTNGEVLEAVKYRNSVIIKKSSLTENYYMPEAINALIYEARGKGRLEIMVDYKKIFSNDNTIKPEVKRLNGVWTVKFNNVKPAYLITATNLKLNESMNESLINYELDEHRNSMPSNRTVYKIFNAEIKKPLRIAFIVTDDLDKGLSSAEELLKTRLKNKDSEPVNESLKKLIFNKRIIAGLPWFIKPWARDELISLKALLLLDRKDLFKKIIMNYVKRIPGNGLFSNNGRVMADSTGWLSKRINDYLDAGLKFSSEERELIINELSRAVKSILKERSRNGLIINNAGETWMDSLMRDGSRIEIQALQLSTYKLMSRLTKAPRYVAMERKLKKRVIEEFYSNGVLHDSPGDEVFRPNAFIAYYVYPELLKKSEWLHCFKRLLEELWLPWNGLASVSRQSILYRDVDDGESSFAYHNGDSWYYINNIAGICMNDFTELREYANKIKESSINDLLYQGSISDCSEISDAKEQDSGGAWAQAWSAATLIELRSLAP